MTEPSQYFKGRTVQEQMNEVIGYVDVRSAEVATTAIAADVAQVHQDMLDADADATAAAASAAAAAGTLTNAVKKTGEASQSIAGDISVSGDVSVGGDLAVTGSATVPAPVNNTDVANKKYVDDQDAALKTYVDTQDATKIPINDINSYAVGLTGNQTKTGILTLKSPLVAQMFQLVYFGSNTTPGWYAVCKLPKTARELTLLTYTPGNLNFVMLETNTHVINVVKWVGNYAPNQNSFAWVETSDAMILYVYSATYRTNIVNVLNYSVYGTTLPVDEIDKSVFTGQPETKPVVGGDIVAVYDETILNLVSP